MASWLRLDMAWVSALLCASACYCEGVSYLRPLRIVEIAPPATSHWLQHSSIINELASRGHSMLAVGSTDDATNFKRLGLAGQHPNITTVTYSPRFSSKKIFEAVAEARLTPGLQGALKAMRVLQNYTSTLPVDTDVLDTVQRFQPDLAVVDHTMPAAFAFADRLGIPKAALLVGGLAPPLYDATFGIGSSPTAYVPQLNSMLPVNMTLFERLQNVLMRAATQVLMGWVIVPISDSSWTEHGIAPQSALASFRNTVSLIISDDLALNPPYPISPHAHVVGALTARPAGPLPDTLEDFMTTGRQHGVVLVSWGTTATWEPAELRSLATALTSIAPAKALWRLSMPAQQLLSTLGANVGDNVRIEEWVPQNDVLGHKALSAFVTQGGTNSLLEAAYHGVPIVGIPLFGEQRHNVGRAMQAGWGVFIDVLDTKNLAANVASATQRLLRDGSFNQAAKRVSAIMRSHRQTPAQRAADALEHAAWTGGQHLHTPSYERAWFHQHNLDVLSVLAILCAVVVGALCFGFVMIFKRIQKGKHDKAD